MMNKRELLTGLALLPLAAPALAQEYPSRPIRLLVGFAAGGSTDVFARAIAPRLQALLGQPVVIENRPGAGGNIATEATARSAPDGYTLLLGTIGPLAINPTLYGNLSFDPLKDLTPVSLVGEVPNVLAVPVDRPFRSVADIIAAAKARPEALNFGSFLRHWIGGAFGRRTAQSDGRHSHDPCALSWRRRAFAGIDRGARGLRLHHRAEWYSASGSGQAAHSGCAQWQARAAFARDSNHRGIWPAWF